MKKGEPWAYFAWIPFANMYIIAKFFQEELGLDTWTKYVMGFYWAFQIIPVVGTRASFAASIFVLVCWCKYAYRVQGGLGIVLVPFLSFILPYIWESKYQPLEQTVEPAETI